MRRFLSFCFLLCISPILTFAQATCSPLDDLILDLLDTCDTLTPDALCVAADMVEVMADGDEVGLLSEISVIEAVQEGDSVPSFMMRLNREDQAVLVLGIGEMTVTNTAPRSDIIVTATRNVNLRQMPSVDASAIGSMTIRENYTAIGRLADNTWVQIQLEDGRVGWASAQYFVTDDGYEALETVTPFAPAYLPMQAMDFVAEDCGRLLLVAPEHEDEAIIFGINGAQITVSGIVSVRVQGDDLTVTGIVGEHVVDTFGFDVELTAGQITMIDLSDSGTIAGIASDPETGGAMLTDDVIEALLGSE